MNLKLIRQRMMDVGPAPEGTWRESTQDVPLMRALLVAKAHEEAQELAEAKTDEERLTELGDMVEVAFALGQLYGFTRTQIVQAAAEKRHERGGFIQPIAGAPGCFTADLLRRPYIPPRQM